MNNGLLSLGRAWAIALLACATWAVHGTSAEPTSQTDASYHSSDVLLPLSARFASAASPSTSDEVPDFQRHIGPLLGRLGCNGRACHGSFQGRGGFQLSLFGYDFKADHAALLAEGTGRVDAVEVEESLILAKPTDADMHEGGKRMDSGSWQYSVLQKWIAEGTPFTEKLQTLENLEVTPSEILFSASVTKTPLKVIAHWADGTKEDVTELCRFTTNDDAIATIDEDGLVTSTGAGDTNVVVAYDKAVVPVGIMRATDIDRQGIARPQPSSHPIDELVQQKLDKLGIVSSERCNDYDFIRRASLDVTGLLPNPQRVTDFVADQSPDKRARLVDELLEQPSYAAWWATRFSDWTGNNEAQLNNYFPARGSASRYWHAWLEKRIADNVPYDEIVEGIVVAESRLPGESYLDYCKTMSEACRSDDDELFSARPGLPQFWARNNFRLPEDRAIGFAYTFLGVRIQCAQCHKHPFDQWSKDDFDKFAVLFTSVQATANNVASDATKDRNKMLAAITGGKDLKGGDLRRRVYDAMDDGDIVPFPELVVREGVRTKVSKDDKANKNKKNAKPPVASGHILGELETITLEDDPRESLMRWLREPNNPYFSKAIVNRIWANHFGIGIVNPTDDMNLGNPPSNGPLLDYLAGEFIRSGYDLKSLHRTILSSHAYQRSSQPNVTNAADQRNFSRHVPRRLPAEVIRDSVYLATASDKDANKLRQTLDGLAIGGQVGSYNRQNGRDFALQVFGQSARESNCDCDRSDQANLLQSIYLQNDIDMHRRLSDAKGWVATTSMAVTGNPLRSAIGGDGNLDDDKTAKAVALIHSQVEKRVALFDALSADKQEKLAMKLERELASANARLKKLGAEKVSLKSVRKQMGNEESNDREIVDTESTVAGVDHSDAFGDWAKSAYLRVLSRTPDEEERQAAVSFIKESANAGEGLESLVWSLLNTKEFILSH